MNVFFKNFGHRYWLKLLAVCGIFLYSKFVCTWLLILHARIQSFKESRVVPMEFFWIELIEAIVHKSSKKRCFWNIGGAYKKTPTANAASDNRVQFFCYDRRHQNEKLRTKTVHFNVLDVHMYALCMCISCLFSSGIRLGVTKFRDLIDFGLHFSLLCFISVRAWVEKLLLKNCIKNLIVVMPSYFYENNK